MLAALLNMVAHQFCSCIAAAFVGVFTLVGVGKDVFKYVVGVRHAVAKGSRYAFEEAKASPRVDVAETPVFGTECEHEGKSVTEPSVPEVFTVFVWSLLGPHLVFLVSDCTPVSSLVSDVMARTGVPGHLFGLVVEGTMVAQELTLSECGVRKDMTICMTARLRGEEVGLIQPSRGGQRLAVWGSGSAWLVNLVGATRFGPGAVGVGCRGRRVNKLWEAPLQALGRQNRRQPRNVPPREVHYPARPQAGSNFQTAPTVRLPRNKGNKQPNPNPAPVQIPQLLELLTQIGCSAEVMDEVRNRISGFCYSRGFGCG